MRNTILSLLVTGVMVTTAAGCAAAAPPAPTPSTAAAAAQDDAANGRGGGNPANRQQVANGTITSVDGPTFSVKAASGAAAQVAVGQQTAFRKFETVPVTELKQGQNIIVRGFSDSNGNLLAQTVQIMPSEDGAGGAQGQGQGQGARQRQGGNGGNQAQGGGGGASGGNRFQGGQGSQGGSGGQGAQGGGQGFQRGTGGAGAQGGATRGRNGGQGTVFGSVQEVQGNTVTIAGPAGSRVFIVNAGTDVRRTVPASEADLKPGVVVTAMGPMNEDGTITARSVTIGDELQ